jgi:S1-C subfamily serine protease
MNAPTSTSLPDTVAQLAASVLGVTTRRHAGSGVLWRPGVLVASASLLWRAHRLALVRPDGEQVAAELRGLDGATDLAAITFDSGDLPAAEHATSAVPRVGDFVFAVGREPSGLVQATFGHIGLVGGAWRSWRGGAVEQLIRLDGGLYAGLEGAPVANGAGQLLGIASSAFSRHHGTVLPVATVDRVLDQLLAHGRVQQGYLGIAAQPVQATLEGAAVEGLLVSSVAAGAPAARAGLLVGDVIVQVGDSAAMPLHRLEDLRAALQPGQPVVLAVARGGQRRLLTVDVAERPHAHCG